MLKRDCGIVRLGRVGYSISPFSLNYIMECIQLQILGSLQERLDWECILKRAVPV